MAVRLTITELGNPGSEYMRSFIQNRIVLGRARSSDVCLPDMAISTRHAEIRLQGNNYVVVDMGSLNGTEVNGTALVAHRPRILGNGDTIQIVGFRICFGLGVAVGTSEPRDASVRQAREILSHVLARSGGLDMAPALVVVQGPGRAGRFELPPPYAVVVVGRESEATISLADRNVSRRHAEIVIEDDGIIVRDNKSKSGVVINGEKVEEARLEPGIEFTLGKTTLALEHPTERSLGVIFEAPEEETSSFSLSENEVLTSKTKTNEEEDDGDKAVDDTERAPVEDKAPVLPPIGPADPLVSEAERPMARNTGHIPIPKTDDKSDFGLIMIGAIIVIAAVCGLIYLFG